MKAIWAAVTELCCRKSSPPLTAFVIPLVQFSTADERDHTELLVQNFSSTQTQNWPLLDWCRRGRWGEAGSCCPGRKLQRLGNSCGYLRRSVHTKTQAHTEKRSAAATSRCRHSGVHSHELWRTNSPEPSQFKNSPVSEERKETQRHILVRTFVDHHTWSVLFVITATLQS